jgi:hypothetical protein
MPFVNTYKAVQERVMQKAVLFTYAATEYVIHAKKDIYK